MLLKSISMVQSLSQYILYIAYCIIHSEELNFDQRSFIKSYTKY